MLPLSISGTKGCPSLVDNCLFLSTVNHMGWAAKTVMLPMNLVPPSTTIPTLNHETLY